MMTIENVLCVLTIKITTCMPWDSASGGEFWDISLLVPSLSFWARGRVVIQPLPTLTYNIDIIRALMLAMRSHFY